MATLTVRRFVPAEWEAYRSLRLWALKESPDAFGGTYHEAKRRSEDHWRSLLLDLNPTNDLPLLGMVNDDAVGLTWGKIELADRTTAHLYQMWVAPKHRGCGLGRQLLQQAVEWARRQGAERVVLSVAQRNAAAQNLYAQAGFAAVGKTEPLRPGSSLQSQTLQLSL